MENAFVSRYKRPKCIIVMTTCPTNYHQIWDYGLASYLCESQAIPQMVFMCLVVFYSQGLFKSKLATCEFGHDEELYAQCSSSLVLLASGPKKQTITTMDMNHQTHY